MKIERLVSISLAFVFLSVSVPSYASAEGYVSPFPKIHNAERYSFQLPSEWNNIKNEELAELNKNTATINSGVTFSSGFIPDNHDEKGRPYILIAEKEIETPPGLNLSIFKSYVDSHPVLPFVSKNSELYPDKNAILYEGNLSLKDQTVHAYIVMFVGHDHMTWVYYYSSENNPDDKAALDILIRTFSYNEKYKYIDDNPAIRVLLKGFGGLMSGLFLVLVIGLYKVIKTLSGKNKNRRLVSKR